jgi:hypothetical protein
MMQNSGPTGSSARAVSHGRRCAQPHSSMPTSRRLPPLPLRTSSDPRRGSNYGHGHGSSSHETADRSMRRLPAWPIPALLTAACAGSKVRLPLRAGGRAPAQAHGDIRDIPRRPCVVRGGRVRPLRGDASSPRAAITAHLLTPPGLEQRGSTPVGNTGPAHVGAERRSRTPMGRALQ